MSLRECFEKRQLRETRKDPEKALRSLEVAHQKYERGKEALENEFFDFAIISGYTSMFHCARGLLYRDGVQEKSHFCLVLYLRERYSDKIPIRLINSLDNYRVERHEALYGLEFKPSRDGAELLMRDAKELIEIAEKMLRKQGHMGPKSHQKK